MFFFFLHFALTDFCFYAFVDCNRLSSHLGIRFFTLLSDWLHFTCSKLHARLSSRHTTRCVIGPRQSSFVKYLRFVILAGPSTPKTPHTAGIYLQSHPANRGLPIEMKSCRVTQAQVCFFSLGKSSNRSTCCRRYQDSCGRPLHFRMLSDL